MTSSAGGVYAALAERRFRSYWISQLPSLLGDALVPVTLSFAVLGGGGSAADLGLLLAAQLLPQILLLGPGGVLADRVSRVRLMVAADVLRGLAQLTTAALLLTNQTWLSMVLPQLLLGAAAAVFRPAAYGLIPSLVSKPRLHSANALVTASTTVTAMVGPLIAALLLAVMPAGLVVAVDGLSYLVSAFALVVFRLGGRAPDRSGHQSFLRDARAGLTEIRTRPWIWIGLICTAVSLTLVTSPFLVLGPLVAERSFGGASTWAVWLVAFSIGELVGSYLAARVRPERPALWASAALILLAIPPLLLALPASAPAITAAEAGAGLAIGWHAVLWSTAIQSDVPDEAMSKVGAMVTFGSFALQPLGLAVTGPFSEVVGVETVFWIASVSALLSTGVLVASRSIRRFVVVPASSA
ncbi:hypothetical protein C6361_34455 [Plantactinospora sp. BC1]|uniref:MFS transporter n=1 Tax=Plantactinospora sp. BC1 TaxID=2108470 RepID=UPI000D1704F9|nr:MFS transporter [Plantactinospora sp. BC1]AVT33700.1 hypothetical protein C6361_34455 [Plantactinospora sp. BC1]